MVCPIEAIQLRIYAVDVFPALEEYRYIRMVVEPLSDLCSVRYRGDIELIEKICGANTGELQ